MVEELGLNEKEENIGNLESHQKRSWNNTKT